jgi:hypothetical protein
VKDAHELETIARLCQLYGIVEFEAPDLRLKLTPKEVPAQSITSHLPEYIDQDTDDAEPLTDEGDDPEEEDPAFFLEKFAKAAKGGAGN